MAESNYILRSASGDREISLDGDKSVGRAESNDIVLTNGHPSRNHARITRQNGTVSIEDLGSSNGTFVNGNRLEPGLSVSLGGGDKVAFDIDEYELVDLSVPEDEGDKTIMRPAEEDDKTVMRPAAELQAALAEAEKSFTEKEKPAEAPAAAPRPGAWADPDAASAVEGKTVLLDKDKLQELMGNAAASLDDLPEQVDVPSLIITSGSLTGHLFPLKEDEGEAAWLIGSEDGCNIVLSDANVSGRHARIASQDGRWQLTDQMTVNGTFVNGKKSTRSYLADGDRLTFGSVTALFRLPGKSAVAKTKQASGGASESKGGGSNTMILVGSFVVTLAVAAAVYFVLMK